MDTNIIIEAFRTRCWKALCGHFAIETVETCFQEALAGDPLRPGYVTVDAKDLIVGLKARHAVSELERIQLNLQLPAAATLDAGERDLLAHGLGRSDAWIVSCADRAGVNAALALGWEPRVVSLEKLAKAVGTKPALKGHFGEAWLSQVRTDHLLGGRLP
ncbi:hypothetical protein [Pseudorhodoferax sp.]|uniref:hypothetical protein n=1 Tax=Pseudorhodoferax sp. TaxID=1993553 RepID=UPI002DD64927|nr:hypothetical protein [Pseudorhodoferax sp.]